MKKMNYMAPEMDVVLVDEADVIRTSLGGDDNLVEKSEEYSDSTPTNGECLSNGHSPFSVTRKPTKNLLTFLFEVTRFFAGLSPFEGKTRFGKQERQRSE